MAEIVVVEGDVKDRPCDLLVLKHANGFFGADKAVAALLKFNNDIHEGGHVFLSGRNIEARKVLFLGVGPLVEFRYSRIREFAGRALEIAAQGDGRTLSICTTLHGPGYGLDERESFLSLVGGFLDALDAGNCPEDLQRIEIVEMDKRRADRMRKILDGVVTSNSRGKSAGPTQTSQEKLSSYGAASERKPKLFAAMPFAAEHSDVWEIAIQEACHDAGIVCERLDKEAYVGDILSEIKKRVIQGNGLVALLDGANPNVFLEIGFAWGVNKPTVLIIKKGANLPFDVSGQKCLQYSSIAELRTMLKAELAALKSRGIFS